MVILDGRCLCVQSCCCLNLVVPALEKNLSRESVLTPTGKLLSELVPSGLTKACSTRSLSSEVTRMESNRESSSPDSEQWANDFELTGWSLFRTRRFVAIPDGLLEEDDAGRKEEADAEAKRQKLRRAFFDEGGTCHW
mmetsp:Transcript_15928/g.35105  ORF Transcript_15928/g.35105 Transcript_15928/m.35105 type:complete len:138 (-) Transcript_15928:86-499(-)